MLRFLSFAIPTLLLILAAFGVVVDVLDLEPRTGAVLRLSTGAMQVPAIVVLGGWIMEVCGLLALFLLAQGRCGNRWLDGLVAGWLAWVFRGPIFVVTIVVATRQPQDPWWRLAFAWWVLYSLCGLVLAALAPEASADDLAEPEAYGDPRAGQPAEEPLSEDVPPEPDSESTADEPSTPGSAGSPGVPELPFEPGEEDPTDRHPTVEALERARGESLGASGEAVVDGGSDDIGDRGDSEGDRDDNVDGTTAAAAGSETGR